MAPKKPRMDRWPLGMLPSGELNVVEAGSPRHKPTIVNRDGALVEVEINETDDPDPKQKADRVSGANKRHCDE
jgi:hypothetical protein